MKLSKIAVVLVALSALWGQGAFAQSEAAAIQGSVAAGATSAQAAAAAAFGTSVGATAFVSASVVAGVLTVTFSAPTGTVSTTIGSI